jgi:hypothetical protein
LWLQIAIGTATKGFSLLPIAIGTGLGQSLWDFSLLVFPGIKIPGYKINHSYGILSRVPEERNIL